MRKHWGNILTIVLTVIILAAGTILPTQLYPLIGQYENKVVGLEAPTGSEESQDVFDEPVHLYPWDQYDSNNVRPLTTAEQSLINDHKVLDYLLAVLENRGFDIQANPRYRDDLLSSFVYLQIVSDTVQSCLVLMDKDLDRDGVADLRCAVDLQGNVISLLILNPGYQKVNLALPPSATDTNSKTTDSQGSDSQGTVADSSTQDANSSISANSQSESTETNSNASDSGQTGTGAGTGTGTGTSEDISAQNATDSVQNSTSSDQPESNANATINPHYLPVNENMSLWAFVHTTTQEVDQNNQAILYDHFRTIDTSFQKQYGYSFIGLLKIQSGFVPSPEELAPINGVEIVPQIFTTNEYRLFIYDLPSSIRVILYLDVSTKECAGFTIQQF
ncbi:MAG: hypothetical protein LBH87_01780 [Coriobacteriales bacterium]|jgi:hypothetical protein|nr:hypothetical protein [Coriobacteriales bacterium]